MATVVFVIGGPDGGLLAKESYLTLRKRLLDAGLFFEFTDGVGYKHLMNKTMIFGIQTPGAVSKPLKKKRKKKGGK